MKLYQLKFSTHFTKILISLILIILVSCNKEPDKIGLDLQTPEDKIKVHYTDQSVIVGYSVYEDSVRTDETPVSLLGSYLDPVFGKTTASFNTQVRLTQNGHTFGTNPFLDSVIIIFQYNGYYGDTTTPLTLRAYELSEKINIDSSYYSDDVVQNTGVEVANMTFQPMPKTSDTVNGEKELPQLQIRLSDDLGNKFLNEPSSAFSDNTAFLDFFYGLNFTIDSVNDGGSILYFNLMASNSKMIIYYSNDDQDSLEFDFAINEKAARFINYSHNYGVSQDDNFKKQLIDGDTLEGNKKIYLQSMGGVKAKLFFPDIEALSANRIIAVNQAKLVINGSEDIMDYEAPSVLAMIKINEDGTTSLLLDQFEPYFGGDYDEEKNQYIFIITRYIQTLISSDEKDYGVYLLISGASYKADRFVFNGPVPDPIIPIEKRLKLNITYTIVD